MRHVLGPFQLGLVAVLFALVCLLVTKAPSPAGAAQQAAAPAPADVPTQDVFAGGDPRKRYFLMGPSDLAAVPEAGFRLLLVLPGVDSWLRSRSRT